jgi:hypothetical protein
MSAFGVLNSRPRGFPGIRDRLELDRHYQASLTLTDFRQEEFKRQGVDDLRKSLHQVL